MVIDIHPHSLDVFDNYVYNKLKQIYHGSKNEKEKSFTSYGTGKL